MKKNISFLIIIISLLIISCNNKKEIKSMVLSFSEIEIPEDLKNKIKNNAIKSYKHKGEFSAISANYTIKYETYEIDAVNSAIKSIKVILDNGKNNCKFNSTINNTQLNAGTRDKYSTFTQVQIGYTMENLFSTKSETTVYNIGSNGTCEAL